MSNTKLPVGIVIINYCSYDDTIECVKSIKESTIDQYRIYIIDNASPDGSGSLLKTHLAPQCKVVLLDSNTGFSRGNNIGIHHAIKDGCNSILILNNDTIIDQSMLSKLIDDAGFNTVTVPVMYYYDKKESVWFGGAYFDYLGIPRHLYQEPSDDMLIECATGCCMFMMRSVIDTVGFWDERYFLYWEDADYSKRMLDSGINIKLIKNAKLWHKVSSSTGGSSNPGTIYYMLRNKLLFLSQYGNIIQQVIGIASVLYHFILPWQFEVAASALFDFLQGKYGKKL